ncbi:MAG: hypothetical protein HY316_08805 [Acidobacteria bacterium]|nr:hypothetical protein [Acidobacteriota bacterium]
MRARKRSWGVSAPLVCAVLAGLWAAPLLAQDGYRMERVEAAPVGIAESVEKALSSQGARLLRGDGRTVAELWLRKEVPLKATAAGAGYGALAEGTLVGVLRFPDGGSDFRGQSIAPGTYTLRYARIPQDGNHLGAAPEPDFLLLCPAAEDRDLDAAIDFESLMELSRPATGTNHPGPLMLQPIATGDFPGDQRNDLGHVALRLKTSAKPAGSQAAQNFPLALTLVGRAE